MTASASGALGKGIALFYERRRYAVRPLWPPYHQEMT